MLAICSSQLQAQRKGEAHLGQWFVTLANHAAFILYLPSHQLNPDDYIVRAKPLRYWVLHMS